MTTRQPNLDRIIQKQNQERDRGNPAHISRARYNNPSPFLNPNGAGEYAAGLPLPENLLLYDVDADGNTLPDSLLTTNQPYGLQLGGPEDDDYLTGPYRSIESLVYDSNNHLWTITLSSSFDALQGTIYPVFLFGGTVGSDAVVNRPVWASKRDLRAGDRSVETGLGHITVGDALFVIRAGGPLSWEVGDRFTDDNGQVRTVQSISGVGRNHYIELIGRSIT